MGSIAATIIAHTLLAFLFVHPVAPLILMGISYSILAASLWPMVAFLVPKKMLGTAYGFMQSIQNLGLAVMYVIISYTNLKCISICFVFFFILGIYSLV